MLNLYTCGNYIVFQVGFRFFVGLPKNGCVCEGKMILVCGLDNGVVCFGLLLVAAAWGGGGGATPVTGGQCKYTRGVGR